MESREVWVREDRITGLEYATRICSFYNAIEYSSYPKSLYLTSSVFIRTNFGRVVYRYLSKCFCFLCFSKQKIVGVSLAGKKINGGSFCSLFHTLSSMMPWWITTRT